MYSPLFRLARSPLVRRQLGAHPLVLRPPRYPSFFVLLLAPESSFTIVHLCCSLVLDRDTVEADRREGGVGGAQVGASCGERRYERQHV